MSQSLAVLSLQACNLLSNLLVVVITWYTTRFHGPIASSNGRGSLMTILRRNGMFCVDSDCDLFTETFGYTGIAHFA